MRPRSPSRRGPPPFVTRPSLRATLLTVAGLAAAVTSPVEAQRAWDDLTRRFDAFAQAAHIVGGTAVLVRKGQVAARLDVGLADRAAGRRITDRTIYHWASVTKTLTAIAVLQLRDRGMLSLDDRVTRWVPELREIHDPEGWADSITVRMLLSHTSGAAVAHLAVVARRAVGAVRADAMGPAGGDDALPAAPVPSGRALPLLQSRLPLPRPHRGEADRRSVGGIRPEEHLVAAPDGPELRGRDAASPRGRPLARVSRGW